MAQEALCDLSQKRSLRVFTVRRDNPAMDLPTMIESRPGFTELVNHISDNVVIHRDDTSNVFIFVHMSDVLLDRMRNFQRDMEICFDCRRPTYSLQDSGTNPCASCKCVSCGGFVYQLHTKQRRNRPPTCNLRYCRELAENIPDLKKQWFALRCLNKSTRELLNNRGIPQPLLQIDHRGIAVRDFLEENIDDLQRFIHQLVILSG